MNQQVTQAFLSCSNPLLSRLFSVKKIGSTICNEITGSNSYSKSFAARLPINFILKGISKKFSYTLKVDQQKKIQIVDGKRVTKNALNSVHCTSYLPVFIDPIPRSVDIN